MKTDMTHAGSYRLLTFWGHPVGEAKVEFIKWGEALPTDDEGALRAIMDKWPEGVWTFSRPVGDDGAWVSTPCGTSDEAYLELEEWAKPLGLHVRPMSAQEVAELEEGAA